MVTSICIIQDWLDRSCPLIYFFLRIRYFLKYFLIFLLKIKDINASRITTIFKVSQVAKFFAFVKSNDYSKVCVMVQLEPKLLHSKYEKSMAPLLEASFKGL